MISGVLDWGAMADGDLQAILDEEDNVKTRIIFAREELKVCWPPAYFEMTVLECNGYIMLYGRPVFVWQKSCLV